MRTGHCILGSLNELRVVRTGKRTLANHAQLRVAKRIVGLNLAHTLCVLDRILMAIQPS